MVGVDLAVTGGKVAIDRDLQSVTLGVRDGKISHITTANETLKAEETLRLEGEVVLPGLVDGHVHFREPGYTEKEGIESGTAAAVAGGVTTVIEMPNTTPPVLTTEDLVEKTELFAEKSRTDFALFGALTEENVGTGDIAALSEAGVTAFKTFMATSFGPLLMSDKGILLKAFEEVASTDRPLYIHAEDEQYLETFRRRASAKHGDEMAAFFESRPEIAETTAVADVLDITEQTGTETVIVHVTTAEALRRIADARERNVPVSAEVTPYHLAFDRSAIEQVGTVGIGTPPVRNEANRQALWECLTSGDVQLIGSDHAPHKRAEKQRPPLDVAPGMPQLETALPSLTDAVTRGKLTFSEIAQLYAEQPARVHGLYPQKGSLQIGADADFVVIDTDEHWEVDPKSFESTGSYSPFEGESIVGRPRYTYQRGELVAEDMRCLAAPGNGHRLTPN